MLSGYRDNLNKLDVAGTELFTNIMIANWRQAEKQCDSKEWKEQEIPQNITSES